MAKKIQLKQTKPILGVSIEGNGKISNFNHDLDKIYEYMYKNGLEKEITNPPMGLFYTEFGGKYIAVVPVKNGIPVVEPMKMITLLSCEVVSLIHKGAGDSIENSFDELKHYFKQHQLEWNFSVREIYLKAEGEKKDYLTEIQVQKVTNN